MNSAGDHDDPAQLYRQAQLLSQQGDHDEALALIDTAARAFRDHGDELNAARCDAGRSNVLDDLGRHVEAADAARRWVAWLERAELADHRLLLAQARANLGVRLESAGDYVGALDAHDAAVAAMSASGDEEMAATMQINRANVLNLLGRSPEALDALVRSADVFAREGNDDDLGVVAVNAGESLCRMGRPDEGLQWFARAERLVASGSPDHAALLVESADALAALGAMDEAALRYADAFDVLATMPLAWLEVRAWTGAARVAIELGRMTEAAAALSEAASRHLAADNMPGWAVAESDAIVLLGPDAPGRRARIETLVEVMTDLDDERWPVQACYVHLNVAELVADEPATAERHLRTAVGLAERSAVPHLVVRVGQRLAELFWRTGRADEAGAVLDDVLRAAERVRGRLHVDELLRTFPRTVADAHDLLVQVRLHERREVDAFALADAGRSRALADISASPSGSRTSGLDETDAELGAIYDRLLAVDGVVSRDLRRQLDDRAVRLEARRDRLELGAVPRPHRAATAVAAPVMAAGEVQILYQIAEGQIGLFVRDQERTTYHGAIATMSDVADDLEAFRSLGRRALVVDRPDRLTASADARLSRLGSRLLGPLEEHLGQATRLVVVPHGSLHGVPFHALVTNGRALLDRVEVAVTPSLAVRASRPVARSGPTLIVGCSAPDVPGIAAEVDALAALMPDAHVLRDDAATIAAVTDAMAGAGCIHLASHGIFRPTAPLRSGIRLADGWLTARHTAGLDLAGSTVVLSACDTGRAVVDAGDELLGLQRGFLLAGARTVVMSHWPAVDDAAVTTMTALYRSRRAGASAAAALREGWLAAREQHRHPWWWAPFFVTGA